MKSSPKSPLTPPLKSPKPRSCASSLRRRGLRLSWGVGALCAIALLVFSGAISNLFSGIFGELTTASAKERSAKAPRWQMPWEEAGLSAEEAAAHLLDRFAFGPRPGDVEAVVDQGLEAWFEAQLKGAAPPPKRDPALAPYRQDLDAWEMSSREILETFPRPAMVLREAQQAGVLDEADIAAIQARRQGNQSPGSQTPGMEAGMEDAMAAGMESGRSRGGGMGSRAELLAWAQEQGYRPQRELTLQLQGAKLVRALESPYPLGEVLTDFWFNHFNVSTSDNDVRPFVLAYERDALRPHVTGSFREMLEAVARHPAMLLYLDNARSVAPADTVKTFDRQQRARRGGGFNNRGGRFNNRGGDFNTRGGGFSARGGQNAQNRPQRQRASGINENYARELLELHTLGVDGGYTQADVEAVARAFTGWSIIPPGEGMERMQQRLQGSGRRMAQRAGFVIDSEGLFLFRADAHDATEKVVLGQKLKAGRGMEDGLEVLDLVAEHPSTARHLAHKLAVRFVADEPPQELVEQLAATWTRSSGDIAEVLRAVVASPQFWAARGEKIKSPFELTTSALRALDADLYRPEAALQWVSRMGQPLYAYQAPTGYPDTAATWVNSGSLLSRMNFGLELAAGEVAGVEIDLLRLNQGREPESPQAALATYLDLLLPHRETAAAVQRLEPMVKDPQLGTAVEEALDEGGGDSSPVVDEDIDRMLFGGLDGSSFDRGGSLRSRRGQRSVPQASPPSALEQVVGVILGSPEFQRR
ncbi:MAG: DUF1800 domain-containing protein [Acidobacteriota bacterium]